MWCFANNISVPIWGSVACLQHFSARKSSSSALVRLLGLHFSCINFSVVQGQLYSGHSAIHTEFLSRFFLMKVVWCMVQYLPRSWHNESGNGTTRKDMLSYYVNSNWLIHKIQHVLNPLKKQTQDGINTLTGLLHWSCIASISMKQHKLQWLRRNLADYKL